MSEYDGMTEAEIDAEIVKLNEEKWRVTEELDKLYRALRRLREKTP